TVGLITYIRTDSVRVSGEAKAAAKDFITTNLGDNYYSDNFYSNKKKEVQDAHEAIRPSYVELDPERLKTSLTTDQYKLYKLIWSRFIASQMAPAKFLAVSANIDNGDYTFRANGSKLIFDGFLRIYGGDKQEDTLLPDIKEGQELIPTEVKGEQNFTQPPARFNEASLIKELEEKNIGRPSTYAPIVATLIGRMYIERVKKALIPTELGYTVIHLLEEFFNNIVDANFTSEMEDKLDDIEVEDTDWKQIIRDFYKDFEKELENAEENAKRVELTPVLTDEICEKCGKQMAIKHGRFGEFLACTGYPECKNAKPIVKSTGIKCPTCGKDIIQRKSKKGKVFFGCSGYPDCKQIYWYKPTDKPCPQCGSLLVEHKTKTTKLSCSNPECKYKE
ncbi:MAG: DNA topoisomerase, partial [Anaerovoracaceae bacterium]